MLRFLLRFLGYQKDDNHLKVKFLSDPTVLRDVIAQDTLGIALICTLPSGGSVIVTEIMAADKKRFWQIWKRLNKQEIIFEDGSKFEPPS